MESTLEKILYSIIEQVERALDGRTQRWLCQRTGIIERDMSLKMNGKMFFTDEELKKISAALKVKIKTPKE